MEEILKELKEIKELLRIIAKHDQIYIEEVSRSISEGLNNEIQEQLRRRSRS